MFISKKDKKKWEKWLKENYLYGIIISDYLYGIIISGFIIIAFLISFYLSSIRLISMLAIAYVIYRILKHLCRSEE